MEQQKKTPWRNNIYIKITGIVVIASLLLIPTGMIKELIKEREYKQMEAVREVSDNVGTKQTITGPYFSVPYVNPGRKGTEPNKSTQYIVNYLNIMPEELNIAGDLTPEELNRGIFKITNYLAELKIDGKFMIDTERKYGVRSDLLLWDQAVLNLGASDVRSIQRQVKLDWNGTDKMFKPGTSTSHVVRSGLSTETPLSGNKETISFSLNLDLKGSDQLYFVPMGKSTNVNVAAPWGDPSFNGAFLPDEREVGKKNFTAHWEVIEMNRKFPNHWIGSAHEVHQEAFGLSLMQPVDNYHKIYRSVRYAMLFISITFLVFFFIEIIKKQFIHPIQYILVGVALVIFYSLLLSITEHLTFNKAFLISGSSTLILIGAYVRSILKSNALAGLIVSVLAVAYTFIFVIIQLQDFALLMGSIGIFMILALVMFFSRKIDWYNISFGPKNPMPATPV